MRVTGHTVVYWVVEVVTIVERAGQLRTLEAQDVMVTSTVSVMTEVPIVVMTVGIGADVVNGEA